jgi:hypothetical protein
MKPLIRMFGFWYGCLGTVAAFAWHVAALLGYAVLPPNVLTVEMIFAVHAVAAIFTFQRSAVRGPAWQPVLSVTPGRIRAAKIVLAVAAANFLLYIGAFLFGEVRGDMTSTVRTVPLIVTSFILLNTVYIAIHWAFRPENLFSRTFIATISNPVRPLLRHRRRR